jgi:hypothetical protein
MAQGPQEFCVGCILPGFFGMFAQKLPTGRSFEPKRTDRKAKPKGRKPKTKRTIKKSLQVKKPRPKSQSQIWATLPDYTDYQNANIERMFRVGRGETINDN